MKDRLIELKANWSRKVKNKKGQFNVEFFTVLILFVGFAAYFSMRLIEIRPIYIREVRQTIIRSEAYRISEMLINDPGSPMDWNIDGEIKRIGLSDHSKNKTNLLSEQKISKFNSSCDGGAGYDKIKNLIGANHNFSIMLIEKLSKIRINCAPAELGENAALIKRLVVFDSDGDGELDYGELIVQVWWTQ